MNIATLFLVLPLVGAFIIPAGKILSKRFGKFLSPMIFAAGAIMGISLFSEVLAKPMLIALGNWQPPFGIALYLGPLGVGAGILIYVLAFFVSLSDIDKNRPAYYNLLFLLFVFAALGMVLTADLFNLFVLMEIGTIALLGLSAGVHKRAGSRGAFKYLVPAGLFSMFMLAAIGLLYSATGTLNMAHLAGGQALNAAFAFIIAVLLFSALFFEAELFPFNTWVPEVYRGSASSFSAAIAGIGGLAAMAVLGRVFLTIMGAGAVKSVTAFAPAAEKIQILLFAVAGASMIIGELAALREKDIKKMLGYSSVGQMGLVAMAIALAGKAGIQAGLFLLLAHTLAKPMLLLISGFFIRKTGRSDREGLRGMGRRHPYMAGMFVAGALSLTGIPLFAGFWGKIGLIKALSNGGTLVTLGLIIILFAAILEGIYFLRVAHQLFEKPAADVPEETARFSPGTLLTAIPVFILFALIMLLGIAPQLAEGVLKAVTSELVNSQKYINDIIPNLTALGAGL